MTGIPKLTPCFVLFTNGEANSKSGSTSLLIYADRVTIFAKRKFGAHSQPQRLSVDSSTVQKKMVVEVTVDSLINQPGEHPACRMAVDAPLVANKICFLQFQALKRDR